MVLFRFFPHTIFRDSIIGHYISAGVSERADDHIRMISTEGYLVDFFGRNISFDERGVPDGGVIKRVEFLNPSSDPLITVSQGSFGAKDLFSGTPFFASLFEIRLKMLAVDNKHVGSNGGDLLSDDLGNDTAFGGDGSDFIDMGAGNDKMKGGADRDEFFFDIGDGRDIITDFEANGTTEHDHIMVRAAAFEQMDIVKRGADVHLVFAPGDVLILRNVDKADISSEDFFVV